MLYVEGIKKCNSEKNEFEYEKLLKNWLKMKIENYLFEEKVDDCRMKIFLSSFKIFLLFLFNLCDNFVTRC